MKWNTEEDRQLFLSIIEASNIKLSTSECENVAAIMKTRLGEQASGLTAIAIKRRFDKIKTMVGSGSSSDDGSPAKKPAKKGPATPRKGKKASKMPEEGGYPSDEAPSKKRKLGAKEEEEGPDYY
ncbi:hypothetical protein BJ508DRAFT_323819 [Ascobolus immersus RN42]|uniref:Myb-like domain-containing protein n=1 Tax=Ascobolus immersus RN42 TaxID=1160509 RepID=A0A3N4IRF6_ASCIM|nr:hypothetical protein BJ508DRAFT_323819 [Ascobolus immersus RN42]